MFNLFKKKEETITTNTNELIGAPVKGKAVPSSQVNDPTFSQEMIGKAMAIIPTEGKIYAPVDGTISMCIDSNHAIGLTSINGTEVLIHIGLDTVNLKGQHFKAHVKENKKVKKGDLLIEFDIDAVKACGYDVITPVIICNSDMYSDVVRHIDKDVNVGDTVLEIIK